MSLCRKTLTCSVVIIGLVQLSMLGALSNFAHAQDENPPKADLFVGYQWLSPGANVPIPGSFDASGNVLSRKLPGMPQGFGLAFGYNFHPNFAIEGDFGGNYKDGTDINTYSLGPRATWRTEGINIFAHTLLSLNRFNAPSIGAKSGIGAILGGGIDLKVNRYFDIRLIEADYQWARQSFANVVPPSQPDLRHVSFEGTRLRTGVVFNFGGGAPPVAPTASCSAQPSEVMVGEPVTVTANTSNFNPKHTVTYNWSSTGGKVTPKDNTATIDTTGVAGGNYTASATATDPRSKKNNQATCSANFTVKEPPKNPPTMSCTATPTSLQAGGTSTITCDCKSPDNVQVNVANWSATGGTVSGSGNTATLNTTGASAGPITVNATCTDSRGLSASSTAQVNVEVPPPPPPQASKLSECAYPNKVKPWRVDNTCKAVLDDVAQALKNQADAKLVAVGFADDTEAKKRKNLAAERAVNAKAYLSGGEAKQGIDPSRIEVRTGSGGGQKAEFWVVPAGASFTGEGTQPVDEDKVKAVPDHPRAPAKKPKAQ
jgi:hypothetical protein